MAGSRTRSFWTRRPNPCCRKRLDRPATDHSAEGGLDRVGPKGAPKRAGESSVRTAPSVGYVGYPMLVRELTAYLQARRMSH